MLVNGKKYFLFILGGITILALCLRLWVSIELRHHPSVISPAAYTDMETYMRFGREISSGEWPEKFYYQPFYYAIFLPLIYLIMGSSVYSVIAVQIILGSVTVFLSGIVTARMFGRTAGIISAILLALSRMHIFYTPFHLITILQSFWLILLLYLLQLAWNKNALKWWVAVVLIAGIASSTRGNALLLIPLILLLTIWRNRRNWRYASLLSFSLLILFYLPQLPFAWRNYQAEGKWVGSSTGANTGLALGNNPEIASGGLGYPPVYKYWIAQSSLPGSQKVSVSQNIIDWVKREPLALAELKFRMLLLFYYYEEIPNNISLKSEGRVSRLLNLPLLTGSGLICVLAIFGMLVSFLRSLKSPLKLSLYAVIFLYSFSVILFYVLARYRIPLLPPMCIFAGAGLDSLFRLRKSVSNRPRLPIVLRYFLLGSVSVFMVCGAFPFYRYNLEKRIMRVARPYGVQFPLEKVYRCYDHGPMFLGGWAFAGQPGNTFIIRKKFRLAQQFFDVVDPYNSKVSLRIPIVVGGESPTALHKLSFEVKNYKGEPVGQNDYQVFQHDKIRWYRVEMDSSCIVGKEMDEIILDMVIRKSNKTNVLLAIDKQRDYQRTLSLDNDGNYVPVAMEACLELDFTKKLFSVDRGMQNVYSDSE